MHTAELDSAVWCTPQSYLKIRISQWNWNRIRKYFSLYIRGLDGFESWKNGGRKSCDTLPVKNITFFGVSNIFLKFWVKVWISYEFICLKLNCFYFIFKLFTIFEFRPFWAKIKMFDYHVFRPDWVQYHKKLCNADKLEHSTNLILYLTHGKISQTYTF